MSTPKNPSKILVILGPTASGKSDLAVKIAKCINNVIARRYITSCDDVIIKGAEIISADSRQVYKGLDLGSGKITEKEMGGIPHHLLDVASPKKTFTVTQYQKLGKLAIKKILEKNKLPIICGGTGLYIDALVYDKQFPEVPPQPKLRKELEKLSTEKLFQKLQKLDPQRTENIDKFNRRRLIRALEIVIATGKPVPFFTPFQKGGQGDFNQYDTLIIGIKKSPKELKKLIARRLYKRLKQGMIEEVKNLHKQGISWKRLDNLGLEYRFISRYLQEIEKINKKNISVNLRNNQRKSALKEMENLIIKESIKYCKRQMTWFKRNKDIKWINPHTQKGYIAVLKTCKKFLKN